MISYIGGKARISKFIIPYIPKDIETYVEPFSGQFWVFFKTDLLDFPNLKTVVYNDYNRLNTNLYRCVKHYDALWEELSKYPTQQMNVVDTSPVYEEMFNKFQKEIFNDDIIISNEPNFEIAAKYVYVLGSVFSGSKPETAKFIDYRGKYRSKVLIFMDKLKHPEYRKHIDRISFIENEDFQTIIEKYDSPSTYFYLDPPYWKTETYYSNHDFDVDDHLRLANCIKNIKGRFGLSYYEFPQLSEWFPKFEYSWKQQSFKKAAGSKKDGTQNDGIELLIMNYGVNKAPQIETTEFNKIYDYNDDGWGGKLGHPDIAIAELKDGTIVLIDRTNNISINGVDPTKFNMGIGGSAARESYQNTRRILNS
jgi:DNA adenine methylase